MSDGLTKAVAAVLKEQNEKLAETFQRVRDNRLALEARVEALEKRAATLSLADHYRGVHQRGTVYERGDLLTAGGGLWLVLERTTDRPGTSDAMRLIVKAAP